jgi:prepilin-type N-terminal cleavage/methylation domain-containing protein
MSRSLRKGFTLIELLMVVGIVAILSAIALPNFLQARERALQAAGAADLRAIATGLQRYYMDFGRLPPADRQAGPFPSHGPEFAAIGDGPAGGGSWDGLPWLLVEKGYVQDWRTLFCPKYLKLYAGGQSIGGEHPRFHNFRYAYNSAGMASGGHAGGAGNVESGTVWIVRDLWLGPAQGFYADSAPNYPADFSYPWGEGPWEGKLEHVIFADFAVRTVIGGTSQTPEDAAAASAHP